MSDELDYKTFDLVAVLSGREYPENQVVVYFDEKLGFTISKVREAINEADRRGNDEVAVQLQTELDNLVAQVKDAEYTVHLRAVDEGVKKGILRTIRSEFPPKRNAWGQEEPDTEAEEAYTRKMWAALLVKVVDPSGAVSLVDEEVAGKLLDKAPKSAQITINQGITELSEGSAAGFEFAAKQADFLLTASPEG